MTLKNILNALPALKKISAQDVSFKTLYKISKLMQSLDAELQFFEEARSKLIKKYCVEENGKVSPKPDMADEFNSQFASLLLQEVSCDLIEPITIPCSENITLSYNDLVLLEKFIKIEENENA